MCRACVEWRQEELERINAELTGAERKAALCQLLDQETQLIASIGRHKNDADEENRSKTIQHFLEKVKRKHVEEHYFIFNTSFLQHASYVLLVVAIQGCRYSYFDI